MHHVSTTYQPRINQGQPWQPIAVRCWYLDRGADSSSQWSPRLGSSSISPNCRAAAPEPLGSSSRLGKVSVAGRPLSSLVHHFSEAGPEGDKVNAPELREAESLRRRFCSSLTLLWRRATSLVGGTSPPRRSWFQGDGEVYAGGGDGRREAGPAHGGVPVYR